ncbi:MAG: phosphatase PAP2 family protein [Nitrospirota bacterium]
MKYLIEIDKAIFYFINITIQNPFFDWLMPFVTKLGNFKIPIITGSFLFFILGKKKERLFLILLIATILFADYIATQFIKYIFIRIRPCNALPNVHLLVGCTGSYSFPSSHAVNITVFAVLTSYKYRFLIIPSIIIALLVCLSRIYVGVHYPFDVLGGAVVGALISIGVIYLDSRYLKRFYNSK